MQIQKIQIVTPKNNFKLNNLNNLSFTKKLVQPDSFINASKQKHNSGKISSFSAITSYTKQRDAKINKYISDSKKELKDLQKTTRAHKKQCLGILKKAKKLGYNGTIDCGDYNITFGTINPDTNKPSTINIWDDGKLAQQYKINSLEPLNIEVYDCELKNFSEEFYIVNGNLATYKSHNKSKNEVTLTVPTIFGFYRVEGQFDERTNSIKKTTEIQYINSKKYPSTYSEYGENGALHYQSDTLTGDWYPKNLNRPDTLSLNS